MLLGIDLGTSFLKVTLFDPERIDCESQVKAPLAVNTPSPDKAEVDAVHVWNLLQNALARLRGDGVARTVQRRPVGEGPRGGAEGRHRADARAVRLITAGLRAKR